ncbi:ATP-binding protein [Streptomyces sp. ISL-44]|uniref:ATP-binding protein n=1 Tax=Streptomyces sp. ISL-44 TaxID=2819184 RepID=UPI001BE9FE0D|nr:ATP-binding protein [Streptomyces sp. ISL-44]MBT2541976.1 ATP-binding protein [Streptomyces sp. ISL-44]
MERMTYWFRHAAEPRAVPLARRFAAQALSDWGLGHMADSVTVIASELMTNAVRATGTTDPKPGYQLREALPSIGVRLRVSGPTLVVEVRDTSRALPRARTPEPDAEDGRGLLLVTLLCERWQSYHHPSGGKVVYAVVPLTPLPVAVEGAPPEPLPDRIRKPRGESRVRPDAALLTRLERLLELRFRRLVAIRA